MKKKALLFILLISTWGLSQSPSDCGGVIPENPTVEPQVESTESSDCSRSSADYLNNYRHLESYIPDQNTAYKTVHINFVIWQNDDGTSNWQNIPQHIQRLEGFVDDPTFGMNFQRFDRYTPPSDPVAGVVENQNRRIRIKLENIYFIQNSAMSSKILFEHAADLQSELFKPYNYPEASKYINVHITTGNPPGYLGFKTNVNGVPVVVTTDVMIQNNKDIRVFHPMILWPINTLLVHFQEQTLMETYTETGA